MTYTVEQFFQDSKALQLSLHGPISPNGDYDTRFLLLDFLPHFHKRYGSDLAAQYAIRYIRITDFLHDHSVRLSRQGLLRWPESARIWEWVEPTLIAFLLDGFVTPEDITVFPSHQHAWHDRIAYRRAMPAFKSWLSEHQTA